MANDKAYQYWLHNLPGIGDRTAEKLLERFKSAQNIYCAEEKELGQVLKKSLVEKIRKFTQTWEVEKKYEEMKQKGIDFYTLEDENYPSRLRKLEHPPYGLYCMGNVPEENRPSAAIIGARECSEYGKYIAEAFAGKMADAGVSVISGMARGIDGIGQRAAVDKEGRTYAVLGSGVDICYPVSNKKLYQDILHAGGGILSVFPPGTHPKKAQFPERNRIVAGLADLILVVEARAKSGTLITVDRALEQGKNIYAVPGRLTDRLSDGCNLLIRQGAGIALTPEDLLLELKVLANRQGKNNKCGGMERSDGLIFSFLDLHPKSADEILGEIRKTGAAMQLPELLAGLVALCVEGKAKQAGGNYFMRSAGDDFRIGM